MSKWKLPCVKQDLGQYFYFELKWFFRIHLSLSRNAGWLQLELSGTALGKVICLQGEIDWPLLCSRKNTKKKQKPGSVRELIEEKAKALINSFSDVDFYSTSFAFFGDHVPEICSLQPPAS